MNSTVRWGRNNPMTSLRARFVEKRNPQIEVVRAGGGGKCVGNLQVQVVVGEGKCFGRFANKDGAYPNTMVGVGTTP